MESSKGKMSGTRDRMKKKGKNTPNEYLKEFEKGERVKIDINPSSQRGMPHPRFNGQVGEVIEKRGNGYVLKVTERNAEKEITVKPEHLKPGK
ncbi:MAG: 50S ribosomal protein L21e [Candidatus Aenigmatarchaeota archaeon]